jgi:tetratricopeptide (TPR) repeat protein
MRPGDEAAGTAPARRPLALVQREILIVLVLCAVSTGVYAATRGLADWMHRTNVARAADWFARGGALAASGDYAAAAHWMRKAVNADRNSLGYALALARTLAEAGRRDEAQRILEQLRESHPDNVEINYRLARLHAAAGADANAVRHYNHAMYGAATFGAEYERWRVRAELIRFLIGRHDLDGALAELALLGRELPDTVDAHMIAGRLSLEAGDARRALAQFREARRLEPKGAAAALGAGDAAFAIGDHALALQEWQDAAAAGADLEARASERAIARSVLASDPLARRLARVERGRRLAAGLAWARARLDGCPDATVDASTEGRPSAIDAIDAMRAQSTRALSDPDTIAEGLTLILLVSRAAEARCPSPDPMARAWRVIAERAQ